MSTPDVTPVQFGIVGLLTAAKVAGVDGHEFYALCIVASIALIADAVIRYGRSQTCAAKALVADQGATDV